MADTLTPNIKVTNQTEGGNDGTWGTIADANFERIDDVFGDVTDITTTGGNTSLTDSQELVNALQVAGTLAANAAIIFSGRGGKWVVENNTTGAYTLTCKVSGQTGVDIPQGSAALVYCDGTDIFFGNPPTALSVTQFDQITDPASGDQAIVADASDSDLSKRISLANLLKVITGLTAETAPATDDEIVLYHLSGTAAKKMTFANFLKVVNALTEDTSPDDANDFLLSYDASAAAMKKVRPQNVQPLLADAANLAPGTLLGILEDRKSAGTSGSAAVAATWNTADLNTEVYDRSSILSVASDQFTISSAGTYEIEFSIPAYGSGGSGTFGIKSRLYNVSNGSVVAYGSSEMCGGTESGSNASGCNTRGIARVTIAGSTTFRIERYSNFSTVRWGLATGSGTEVYTRVVIRKG